MEPQDPEADRKAMTSVGGSTAGSGWLSSIGGEGEAVLGKQSTLLTALDRIYFQKLVLVNRLSAAFRKKIHLFLAFRPSIRLVINHSRCFDSSSQYFV